MRKLIGTIVLLGVIVYFGFQAFAGKMIAGAVEQATGVPTEVKSVHLKFAPIEFGIYGMKLKNAADFQEPVASIPKIFVQIKPLAIFQGKIHVQKVAFHLEQITLEKSQKGSVNLKKILDHSKKQTKKTTAPGPSQPSEPSQPAEKKPGISLRTQIDEAEISLGTLAFVDYGSGQRVVRNIDLKVDDLKLKNVTDSASLIQQIVLEILKRVGLSGLGIQIDSVAQNIGEQASQLLNEAKTKLSGLFGSK